MKNTLDRRIEEAKKQLSDTAPELLEALCMCADYFSAIDKMQPLKNHGLFGTLVRNKTRAAIDKATKQT